MRRHPVAEALAAAVRRHDLPRASLEAMIDGQLDVLEAPALEAAAAVDWADAVQGSLARLVAKVLEPCIDPGAVSAAGRAWGLALLIRARLATIETVRAPLRQALDAARRDAKATSAAALPALLPARLARFDLAGRTPGPLRRRLSLVLAVAAGRV